MLMRPSQPVRHFCAFLNHGFFCSCLRFSLLVERLGTATRFTPRSLAAASLAAEKNPASAAARSGARPSKLLVLFDGRRQQIGVAGALVEYFAVDDDLMLRRAPGRPGSAAIISRTKGCYRS